MSDTEQRLTRIVLAADAYTRYPEDSEAWHELCSACEAMKDAELDVLRKGVALPSGEKKMTSTDVES